MLVLSGSEKNFHDMFSGYDILSDRERWGRQDCEG